MQVGVISQGLVKSEVMIGWSCSSAESSEIYLEFQLGNSLENRHLEERGGEWITLRGNRWVKLTIMPNGGLV